MKKNKRKVAVFDIDGTIFRSSLLIEVTNALVIEGIFSAKAKKIYEKSHENWTHRKGSYEKYIMAVVKAFEENIRGVKHDDFIKIAKKVVDLHKNRVYRYTRDLVKSLKKKNYYLLAISHSPKELVESFCEHLGFDKVYGFMYEVGKNGIFTGRTLFRDLILDKSKILDRAVSKEKLTLEDSVGVGDSESDIIFLRKVAKPICFNPNLRLYEHAKQAKWKIVVERKDVIYEMRDGRIQAS
jgi:HAD superfamily hydrolase (TIGR01490 family)